MGAFIRELLQGSGTTSETQPSPGRMVTAQGEDHVKVLG